MTQRDWTDLFFVYTHTGASLIPEPMKWLGHWQESLVLCHQFSSYKIKQVLLDFQAI